MNFKFVILILLFIGILCVTINLTQSSYQCPTTKIIYKYVPRTFDEEQREPVYPSDIFKTMFSQQSPWIRSISDLDTQKQEVMNKYFVSQY
jgi:predicted transcriptional regulator YheO